MNLSAVLMEIVLSASWENKFSRHTGPNHCQPLRPEGMSSLRYEPPTLKWTEILQSSTLLTPRTIWRTHRSTPVPGARATRAWTPWLAPFPRVTRKRLPSLSQTTGISTEVTTAAPNLTGLFRCTKVSYKINFHVICTLYCVPYICFFFSLWSLEGLKSYSTQLQYKSWYFK